MSENHEAGEVEKSGKKSPGRSLSSSVVTWGVILVVVTGLVSWFAFAAVYGVGVGAGGSSPAAPKGGGTDYVYLSIGPGVYNSSMDQYTPANFTIPAHTLVVFHIVNNDNGLNAAPMYTQVSGTVNNLIHVDGASTGVSSVSVGSISHTFTIMKTGFNVPVPAATATGPTTVDFSAYFNDTGTFVWNCMAPCDPTSMASPGFMTGTLTVA